MNLKDISGSTKITSRISTNNSPLLSKEIDWTLLLIKTTRIVSENHLKHLTETDGLWEVRVSADNGIFRIFCFFDKGNLIILLHGFQKK
ncbi:type II toxin-antitoxin system RelE/ParE family toxin [Aequorivita viscosa]|uniref:type II toxin-antitoxin system RelE/ParE family toxin n=1 Tax=Aequorivita viscosa TaxID=797419 RepID=UPI001F33DBEE|nr:type II toxin-antitoxin system RelE/ParE family toxin [Aequorivita viscosa]